MKMTIRPLQGGALLALAVIICGGQNLVAARPHAWMVDDLLHTERLWAISLSPDGRWLTYSTTQPEASTPSAGTGLWGSNRLWVAPVDGGAPQEIGRTERPLPVAFLSRPRWSARGERLAWVTLQGDRSELWVWTAEGGPARRLRGERGVGDIEVLQWLEDRGLLILAPEADAPDATQLPGPIAGSYAAAVRAWTRFEAGEKPTASVLDSGVEVEAAVVGNAQANVRQLVLVDVGSGQARVLTQGEIAQVLVAPDSRHAAVLHGSTEVPVGKSEQQLVLPEGRLEVVALTGKSVPSTATGLAKVVLPTPRAWAWAPDSKSLALIGVADGGSTPEVFEVTLSDGLVTALGGTAVHFGPGAHAELAWAQPRTLLVYGPGVSQRPTATAATPISGQTSEHRRSDWWVMEAPGRWRNLTASLPSPPTGGSSFWIVPEARIVAGATRQGELWRAALDGVDEARPFSSTAPDGSKLEPWRGVGGTAKHETRNLIMTPVLASEGNDSSALFRVDLVSGKVRPLQLEAPAPDTRLAAYATETGAAVWEGEREPREPTTLWLGNGTRGGYRKVLETNTHLPKLAPREFKRIDYRSLDGQPLVGWLSLPYDYQEGKRYPLLVSVYGGKVFKASQPNLYAQGANGPLANDLYTGRGYAVLYPSIPLGPDLREPGAKPSDPMLDLAKGVLPAVDKVVEIGMADPQRLGLMGQSYGGYTVNALVTQTTRFQAAVALASLTDLVSRYGIFRPQTRYSVDDSSEPQSNADSPQDRMGRPPWEDADRYRRNSPLSYVHRVETPLLLIHGDMDKVVMQEAEQFFTALKRQGKRARFVRYWGEGHTLVNPLNVRDAVQQIFTWFDELLDVARDADGHLVWKGDQVQSRNHG